MTDALSLFDAGLRPRGPLPSAERRASLVKSAPSPPRRPRPDASSAAPALLAVDGNSLLHRAFHAYGPMGRTDAAGRERGGLYGFLALLTAVCDQVSPRGVIVGFDCRAGSKRRQRWSGYKATRTVREPALDDLLDLAPTLLVELGVCVCVPAGWEADDVLGSAAATAERSGWRAVLATSDRDAFALISDRTTVLRLRSGLDNAVSVDRRRLRRDTSIAPEQYRDFAALRGDTSDNLPGIPGIGPSRAAALLAVYPSVVAAVADPLGCRSVLGAALGQKLLDDVASADSVYRRNVELMTIRTDVPIDLRQACRRLAPASVAATLRRWGLSALQARLLLAFGPRPELAPPPGDIDAPPA